MPKIRVEGVGLVEVPDKYCDKYENVCPMCVDDGVTSYCMLFKHGLEQENYHYKRLKICKQSEVEE